MARDSARGGMAAWSAKDRWLMAGAGASSKGREWARVG